MIKGLHKKNNDLFKIFVLTSMVFLAACRGDHIVKEEPSVPSGVKKILILPFKDISGVFGENENRSFSLQSTTLKRRPGPRVPLPYESKVDDTQDPEH